MKIKTIDNKVKNFKLKITIEGKAGSGKSIMISCIYNYLLTNGYPVGLYAIEPHAIYTQLKD